MLSPEVSGSAGRFRPQAWTYRMRALQERLELCATTTLPYSRTKVVYGIDGMLAVPVRDVGAL